MTSLTREKVVSEAAQLNEQFKRISRRYDAKVEATDADPPAEVLGAHRELVETLPTAQKLITSNDLDFRQAELGLAQMRRLMAVVSGWADGKMPSNGVA